MSERAAVTALGLMSGTSLDGIDAAIVRTDGERIADIGPAETIAYEPAFRGRLRGLLGRLDDDEETAEVARELTDLHARAVRTLLARAGARTGDVRLIGFHGHTVAHQPAKRITRQIGDGAHLARMTGITVVDDFRSRDVAGAGEGAPLAPLFHAALARDLEKPLCVLNLGGVANVTYIAENGDVLAFDTGPGNALLDDWMGRRAGTAYDAGGRLAASGHVNHDALATLLQAPYFDRPPPKSLDRDAFGSGKLGELASADGAATLAAFTVEAVIRGTSFFPQAARRWLVCGGGRRNETLMRGLADSLKVAVEPVEAVGWLGDALEAQAFAFLAVRSLYGLPISLPSTTGVERPLAGGTMHRP
ncbi:MAG: anhydro-N-acetylmuramic acid kinase [Rhodospirillales bacterium]|nr:anhydro-N-acetylmuramic acid kinase [Rhodospirillales bacterium]